MHNAENNFDRGWEKRGLARACLIENTSGFCAEHKGCGLYAKRYTQFVQGAARGKTDRRPKFFDGTRFYAERKFGSNGPFCPGGPFCPDHPYYPETPGIA